MARTKYVDPISPDKKLDQEVDGLLSGRMWAETTIKYSFPDKSTDYEKNYGSEPKKDFAQFDTDQRDAFHSIFDNIEDVAALDFTFVADETLDQDASIRLATSDLTNAEALAHYPSTEPKGGDAWFDSDLFDARESVALGSYNYTVFMHELGHALGLKHSFETGPYGAAPRDSLEYTVMSYSSYEGAGIWSADDGHFPQTLMMYDIAALQKMYGANFTKYSGNTTYQWDPDSGALDVSDIDTIDGSTTFDTFEEPSTNVIFMTVWDGDGIDTYDFSNYTADDTSGLFVDLRPGGWTKVSANQLADLDGTAGTIVAAGNIANSLAVLDEAGKIANLIENVIGAVTDDHIIGNVADNEITGGDGNDTFVFFAGEADGDTLIDFSGNGASEGDFLEFHGFGTAEQGATFTLNGVTGTITSGLDGHEEIITLANMPLLDASDYLFL